jgi:hypothetical protein
MNAYDSYRKVLDVINHNDNTKIHIPAINKLVENYEHKFPEEGSLCSCLFEYKSALEKTLKYEQQ